MKDADYLDAYAYRPVAPPKRKKNTSAKGALLERNACAVLTQRGYKCATAGKVLMRLRDGRMLSRQHDLFGAFDIVAVKPGEPVLFVQVSVHSMRSVKRKQVEPILPALPFEHSDAEVWGWVGGRKPRGQRFRVQRWNSVEWADAPDAVFQQEVV